MYRFYLAAVDTVPAAMLLIPLFVILYWTAYRKDLRKSVMYCLFALYFAAVLSVVGLPNVRYVRFEPDVNWIPFRDMLNSLTGTVFNVLLFMPMGLLLPILWNNFRKKQKTVAFGFVISLLIEFLQLFTYRATDIDDLMTNTFGTLLGFFIAKILIKRYNVFQNTVKEKGTTAACFLCVLVSLIMFFLYPFISPMIWDRIL